MTLTFDLLEHQIRCHAGDNNSPNLFVHISVLIHWFNYVFIPLLQVDGLVSSLHEKLDQVEFSQTKTGILRTIRTLAGHHLNLVLKSLISYPIPFDRSV